jgi:hypothetical protein
MTGNVSWAELTFIVGMLGAAVAAVAVIMLWLWNKFNKIYKNVNEVKIEFVSLRLEIAKEYVTIKALDKVTDQMNQAMDRLGTRIENLLRAIGVPISPVEH